MTGAANVTSRMSRSVGTAVAVRATSTDATLLRADLDAVAGDLSVRAGRDATLTSSPLAASGSVLVEAGRDLRLSLAPVSGTGIVFTAVDDLVVISASLTSLAALELRTTSSPVDSPDATTGVSGVSLSAVPLLAATTVTIASARDVRVLGGAPVTASSGSVSVVGTAGTIRVGEDALSTAVVATGAPITLTAGLDVRLTDVTLSGIGLPTTAGRDVVLTRVAGEAATGTVTVTGASNVSLTDTALTGTTVTVTATTLDATLLRADLEAVTGVLTLKSGRDTFATSTILTTPSALLIDAARDAVVTDTPLTAPGGVDVLAGRDLTAVRSAVHATAGTDVLLQASRDLRASSAPISGTGVRIIAVDDLALADLSLTSLAAVEVRTTSSPIDSPDAISGVSGVSLSAVPVIAATTVTIASARDVRVLGGAPVTASAGSVSVTGSAGTIRVGEDALSTAFAATGAAITFTAGLDVRLTDVTLSGIGLTASAGRDVVFTRVAGNAASAAVSVTGGANLTFTDVSLVGTAVAVRATSTDATLLRADLDALAGDLSVRAGRDATVTSSPLSASGSVLVEAGRDLRLASAPVSATGITFTAVDDLTVTSAALTSLAAIELRTTTSPVDTPDAVVGVQRDPALGRSAAGRDDGDDLLGPRRARAGWRAGDGIQRLRVGHGYGWDDSRRRGRAEHGVRGDGRGDHLHGRAGRPPHGRDAERHRSDRLGWP